MTELSHLAGKAKRPWVTQELLKQQLHYDPATGHFTYIHSMHKLAAGTIAGSLSSHGYVKIIVSKRTYSAQRLAWLYMNGEWPKGEIDHKDNNRTNNSWDNLREATKSQNQSNAAVRKDNKSGFKGVTWDRRSNKWRAAIRFNKKRFSLGGYDTAEEAYAAYCAAATKYHGEFARLK
jgi:hypothetical protein